jgi:hypothetical protein
LKRRKPSPYWPRSAERKGRERTCEAVCSRTQQQQGIAISNNTTRSRWTHSRVCRKSPPRPRGPGRRERHCCAAHGTAQTSASGPDRLQYRFSPADGKNLLFGYAPGVNLKEMIAELDQEIARLEQARQLLASGEGNAASRPQRGRPARTAGAASKGKRRMSPEGLARIREAQKRRWAAQRRAAKKNAAAAANTAE